MRTLRRLAWPLTVTAAMLAVVAPWLGPGHTLAWRDTLRSLAPVRLLVVEALRDGRLPLWNPHEAAGMPLFAQSIHGVLHPVSLLAAWVAPGAGVDALLVAYLLVAALGAWVAARSLGASPAEAAVAGIGYGASGAILSGCGNLLYLAGPASVPWVVAAARWAAGSGRFGIPLVAIAFCASIFAGDPQSAIVAALFAGAVAWEAGGAPSLGRCAAGLALGALGGAIQLVPSWTFLQETTRSVALDAATRRQWALSGWRAAELLLPGLVGGVPGAASTPVFVATEPEALYTVPFLPSLFVGAPLFAAAIAGVRTRAGRALGALAVLWLWLAFGHRLGAQQLLAPVPIWGGLRYAEKLVAPLTLAVALLAALGVPRLLESRRARWAAAAVLLLCGLGWLLAALLPGPAEGLLGALGAGGAARVARAHATVGLGHLTLGLVALGAWLVVGRRGGAAMPGALAAIVLVQQIAASPFALHSTPRDAVTAPPLLDAAPPGPRLATPVAPGVLGDPGATDAIDRVARAQSASGLPEYNVAARLDNVDAYTGFFPIRYERLYQALGDGRWRVFRRFAVTHVAWPRHVGDDEGALLRAATAGGRPTAGSEAAIFHEVPHRPWATFVERVRIVGSAEEAAAAIAAGAPEEEVALEAGAVPPLAPGRVIRIERRPERVVVDADASGDGLLLIEDAYWPGWKGTIDGAPVPVLAADGLVRAIPFPAGRHRLELRYEPPELLAGKLLSAVGLLALLALAALEWRRRGATSS